MSLEFDVIITGAGPGGCLAARNLARAGFKVGLFDVADYGSLGKTVIAETEKSIWPKVGLEGPLEDEVPYRPKGVKVFSNRGRQVIFFDDQYPTVPVFLDRVVKRICKQATDAGATLLEKHKAVGLICQGGFVRGVKFETPGGPVEATAPLTVDATGIASALVKKLPPQMGIEFEDREADLIMGDNRWYEVDPEKARQAVADGVHTDQMSHSRLGFSGAFSMAYSYLSTDKQRAFTYIGYRNKPGAPAMKDLKNEFTNQNPYIGKELYGAHGAIRIRHGLDKLVADGFLALGDAACQTVPLHASGVGSALFAADLATDTMVKALRKGDTRTRELWPYCVQYQKGRGSIMATFDAVALITASLTNDQFMTMLESGLINGDDLLDAAYIKYLTVTPTRAPGKVVTIIRHAGFIGSMLKLLKSVLTIRAHWARYPKTWDEKKFNAWRKKAAKIFDPLQL